VNFMGDLAEAVWLLRVNELRVGIVEQEDGGNDEETGAGEAEREYDLLLKLIL